MVAETILIIEDEHRVQYLLKTTLEKNGYFVRQSYNLKSAKQILLNKHVDLVCLDLNLPDGDGHTFCKWIKNHCNSKIIVLTKRTSVQDRLESFKTGADDYVPKPFYPSELTARINKQLTGQRKSRQKLIVNRKTGIITVLGMDISLTTSQILFLEALQREAIESREEIRRYISSQRGVRMSNSSLTVLSTRLRRKIKQQTGTEIYTTVYSKGYRLIV